MYKCPIDYYLRNLVFNEDKSCWAVFRIKGYDYDFLSDERKLGMLHKMTRYLSGIMTDVQIIMLPVEQNIKEHFERLKGGLRQEDVLYPTAVAQAEQTEQYLTQSLVKKGEKNDYRSYICVKLQEYADSEVLKSIKDGYEYFIRNPMNAINVWMSLDTKDILTSKISSLKKLAEKWFFDQNKRIQMQEADTEEMQWIFRRMAFRGVSHPVPLFYKNSAKQLWEPKSEKIRIHNEEDIIRPLKRDIVNLFSGTIRTKNRNVIVEHDGFK